ncbi:MAG: ADP-ribosylglycohydrolase family protein, partial [Deltaproteobacteria bacterium]|nr:ADP-ribosylglycohydrolase family protein [Deltaproteobacteria bacterium]
MTENTPQLSLDPLTGRLQAVILGLAGGEALGWPNEQFWGARLDKHLIRHPHFQFRSWLKRSGGSYYGHDQIIQPGQYSGHTQLMLAVARSLRYGPRWADRFTHFELPFWAQYDQSGRKTSRAAAKLWSDRLPPWSGFRRQLDIRRYFESAGNGVLVRIMPLVIFNWEEDSFEPAGQMIVQNGLATHGHPGALIGALAVGRAVWLLLKGRPGGLDLLQLLTGEAAAWSQIPSCFDLSDPWFQAAASLYPDFRALWQQVAQEMVSLL